MEVIFEKQNTNDKNECRIDCLAQNKHDTFTTDDSQFESQRKVSQTFIDNQVQHHTSLKNEDCMEIDRPTLCDQTNDTRLLDCKETESILNSISTVNEVCNESTDFKNNSVSLLYENQQHILSQNEDDIEIDRQTLGDNTNKKKLLDYKENESVLNSVGKKSDVKSKNRVFPKSSLSLSDESKHHILLQNEDCNEVDKQFLNDNTNEKRLLDCKEIESVLNSAGMPSDVKIKNKELTTSSLLLSGESEHHISSQDEIDRQSLCDYTNKKSLLDINEIESVLNSIGMQSNGKSENKEFPNSSLLLSAKSKHHISSQNDSIEIDRQSLSEYIDGKRLLDCKEIESVLQSDVKSENKEFPNSSLLLSYKSQHQISSKNEDDIAINKQTLCDNKNEKRLLNCKEIESVFNSVGIQSVVKSKNKEFQTSSLSLSVESQHHILSQNEDIEIDRQILSDNTNEKRLLTCKEIESVLNSVGMESDVKSKNKEFSTSSLSLSGESQPHISPQNEDGNEIDRQILCDNTNEKSLLDCHEIKSDLNTVGIQNKVKKENKEFPNSSLTLSERSKHISSQNIYIEIDRQSMSDNTNKKRLCDCKKIESVFNSVGMQSDVKSKNKEFPTSSISSSDETQHHISSQNEDCIEIDRKSLSDNKKEKILLVCKEIEIVLNSVGIQSDVKSKNKEFPTSILSLSDESQHHILSQNEDIEIDRQILSDNTNEKRLLGCNKIEGVLNLVRIQRENKEFPNISLSLPDKRKHDISSQNDCIEIDRQSMSENKNENRLLDCKNFESVLNSVGMQDVKKKNKEFPTSSLSLSDESQHHISSQNEDCIEINRKYLSDNKKVKRLLDCKEIESDFNSDGMRSGVKIENKEFPNSSLLLSEKSQHHISSQNEDDMEIDGQTLSDNTIEKRLLDCNEIEGVPNSVGTKSDVKMENKAIQNIVSLSESQSSIKRKKKNNLKSNKKNVSKKVNLQPSKKRIKTNKIEKIPIIKNADGTFKCGLCTKIFALKRYLKKHHLTHFPVPESEKPFKCLICSRAFSRERNLKRHSCINPVLEAGKTYTCDQCGKIFYRQINLRKHRRTHSDKMNHTCKECGKGFIRKTDYTSHCLTHSDNKPFICDVCKRSFTRKSHLIGHCRTHAKERPFVCTVCNKGFLFERYLNEHSFIHTDQKPFACDKCNKGFARRGQLNEHYYLIHADYRPFKCADCDKDFCLKRHLQAHQLSHLKEKPFSCDICEKGFTRKSNLQTHRLMHIGGNSAIKKRKQKKNGFDSGSCKWNSELMNTSTKGTETDSSEEDSYFREVMKYNSTEVYFSLNPFFAKKD